MPIRIALGEDSLIVRVGVRQLSLSTRSSNRAGVADQPSLRRACDEEHPDVVLSDIRMPPTHSDEVAGAVAEIDRAKQLLDRSAITQAEFDAIKAKALV